MHDKFNTPTEENLAKIWAEVIGLNEVDRNEDFFDIGGDSLLATKVVLRARREWKIKFTVRLLIDAPVLADLAACVDRIVAESSEIHAADTSSPIAV